MSFSLGLCCNGCVNVCVCVCCLVLGPRKLTTKGRACLPAVCILPAFEDRRRPCEIERVTWVVRLIHSNFALMGVLVGLAHSTRTGGRVRAAAALRQGVRQGGPDDQERHSADTAGQNDGESDGRRGKAVRVFSMPPVPGYSLNSSGTKVCGVGVPYLSPAARRSPLRLPRVGYGRLFCPSVTPPPRSM